MILDLFIFYFYIFFCSVSVFGYGILFTRFLLDSKVYNPGLIGLFGFLVLFFISLFFHFFINLHQYFNLLILFIGLIIGLKYLNLFKNIKEYKFLFLLFSIIFLLSIFTSRTYADYEWYHLPYLNYLTNFKIIFGLVNFSNNYVYGHGWLDIIGLFNLPIIETRGITSLPIIFYFYFITFFLHELFNSKNLQLRIYSLFTITLTFVVFNRLKDFGADIQPTFTISILIFFILKYILENQDNSILKYVVVFFFYSCILRIGSIVILPIFIFFLIFNFNKYLYDFLRKNLKLYIFLILFFFIFLTKNLITSGCFFYPIPMTCFENNTISWASPKENVKERFEFLSAISKRWKFYSIEEGQLENKYSYYPQLEKKIILAPKAYNSIHFFWIKYFFYDHDYKRLLNLFLLSIIFFSFLFFTFTNYESSKNKNANYFNYFLITLLISILLWFFNSPQMRYGGYPIFAALIYGIAILFYHGRHLIENKFIIFKMFFLILGIIFFGFKNINNTVYDVLNNNFSNFPWPNLTNKLENEDYYSKNYSGVNVNFITKNDDILPGSPKTCGKVPMPCLASGREVCITKLSQKNNYIFLSNNNKKCLEQFKKNYWQH